jgi:hypothetical protein
MTIIQCSFISGVMVGLEVSFQEPYMPYTYSIVIDLFIVRVVIQKMKHVR